MHITPLTPFEPIQTSVIPSGPNWVAQVKWDGVRMLTYCDGNQVQFYNRHLHNRSLQYPELSSIHEYCDADEVILDGEIIALENGRPDFSTVMQRDGVRSQQAVNRAKQAVPIVYMVFDVLYHNGVWVTTSPLRDRQTLLTQIVHPHPIVHLVDNHSDGQELFDAIQAQHMEGIVVKDLNSTYDIGGKDKRWQKVKNIQDLVAVVAGVSLRDGIPNALLMGLYDDTGALHYIGHVGSGSMKQKDWRTLGEGIGPLVIDKMPFTNSPQNLRQKNIWLQPLLTVKVRYLEWTHQKTLRQPVIEAFVSIDPKTCTF